MIKLFRTASGCITGSRGWRTHPRKSNRSGFSIAPAIRWSTAWNILEGALAEQRVGALPELYATTKRDFAGRGEAGVVMIRTGNRVRVNDVGRFNDIGITLQINEAKSYQARAALPN